MVGGETDRLVEGLRPVGVAYRHRDQLDLPRRGRSLKVAQPDVLGRTGQPGFEAGPRVRSLTAELCKGLEFDLVVLVDSQRFGDGIAGAVDRNVAMTRATQQLIILTGP